MNQKITFPELVSAISESTGFSKYISEEFLKELFALVASKLVEEKMSRLRSSAHLKLSMLTQERVSKSEPVKK